MSTSTDFESPELSVENINTTISGNFIESDSITQLPDASNTITLFVAKEKMNQIFLFFSDDTSGNSEASDLSDFSGTDLKYAINLDQWNPKLETKKEERRQVVNNYLIDLFGGGPAQALLNTDVFSNEDELDNDISDIFQNRASSAQRSQINTVDNGSFQHAGSLSTVSPSTIINSASIAGGAITRKLLQSAAIAARDNQNNHIFRRQFDLTNTSNADYNLPPGWRTFQFVHGDSFSYNLSVKQLNSSFPEWSANQNARTDGGLATSYRVKFIIHNEPSGGGVAEFFTPAVDVSRVETVSNSASFNNIIVTEISSVDLQDVTVVTNTAPTTQDVVLETEIVIANVDFATIPEVTKTNIIFQIFSISFFS